jgi:hypothetical protein
VIVDAITTPLAAPGLTTATCPAVPANGKKLMSVMRDIFELSILNTPLK